MSLGGFLHNTRRGRTRTLIYNQSTDVLGRELYAVDQRRGFQGLIGNIENAEGGVKQFGKVARNGYRRRRVDGAIEGN
jgi:hypothetical protein